MTQTLLLTFRCRLGKRYALICFRERLYAPAVYEMSRCRLLVTEGDQARAAVWARLGDADARVRFTSAFLPPVHAVERLPHVDGTIPVMIAPVREKSFGQRIGKPPGWQME